MLMACNKLANHFSIIMFIISPHMALKCLYNYLQYLCDKLTRFVLNNGFCCEPKKKTFFK